MKKVMITVAMTAALVLALGGTALARGAEPANRSSSYLAKGQSYISWSAAQTKMAAVGVAAEATATAHGNYSTTTVKCQVCHSAHKASATGSKLLQKRVRRVMRTVPRRCHRGFQQEDLGRQPSRCQRRLHQRLLPRGRAARCR